MREEDAEQEVLRLPPLSISGTGRTVEANRAGGG